MQLLTFDICFFFLQFFLNFLVSKSNYFGEAFMTQFYGFGKDKEAKVLWWCKFFSVCWGIWLRFSRASFGAIFMTALVEFHMQYTQGFGYLGGPLSFSVFCIIYLFIYFGGCLFLPPSILHCFVFLLSNNIFIIKNSSSVLIELIGHRHSCYSTCLLRRLLWLVV